MSKLALRTLILTAAIATTLGGCTTSPVTRNLAGRLGAFADGQRARIVDAQGRYDRLNQDAARERGQLEEQTLEAQRRVNTRVRGAKLARPPVTVLAEASSPEAIVASLKITAVTVAALDAGDAAAKLEEASKVAAQIAAKPGKQAQLQQALGIYREIQTQLAELQAPAEQQTADSQTAGADKASGSPK